MTGRYRTILPLKRRHRLCILVYRPFSFGGTGLGQAPPEGCSVLEIPTPHEVNCTI